MTLPIAPATHQADAAPMPKLQRLFPVLLAVLIFPAATLHGMPIAVPAAPAPKATPAAEPAAVDVADIPALADLDQRLSERTQEATLAAGAPAESFARRLAMIEAAVEDPFWRLSSAELRQLAIPRLESISRHWHFQAGQLARWRSDLALATSHRAGDAAGLAARRKIWLATADSDLPPSLQQRVDEVVTDLEQAEMGLSEPLARLMTLGRRGNAVAARIEGAQRRVDEAVAAYDIKLMRLDSPPLWQLGRDTVLPVSASSQVISNSLEIESRFAAEYVNGEPLTGGRALQGLLMCALPLLLWLAWRSRGPIASGQISATEASVLSRPLSCWMLLVVVGVFAFQPDAPMLTQQLALVLAVVPVLRLLPTSHRHILGITPYLASALFLLLRLGFVFLPSAPLYRAYILLLGVLGLACAGWLLWQARRRPAQAQGTQLARALRTALHIASFLLAVALLANAVGNVSLAETVTGGVIDSVFFAMLLLAARTVLATWLQLLLKRPGVSRFRLAQHHAGPAVQMLLRLLTVAAVAGWIVYTLDRFRLLPGVSTLLSAVLGHAWQLGDLRISLGHVLIFVLTVVLAFWLARTIRLILDAEILSRMSLPHGVANSVASLSYYAIVLLGLVGALSAAGFKAGQLTFVLGALGVGIGLGLQNVVNNFVSGLVLIFERPFQPGDVVEVGGTRGRVRDIGMRATRLATFDGASVVVPNGQLISQQLVNWTLFDRNRRLDLRISVPYGSDVGAVKALLGGVVAQTEGVAAVPAPVILFDELGGVAMEFVVHAWTNEYDDASAIRSVLLSRIYDALIEQDIGVAHSISTEFRRPAGN